MTNIHIHTVTFTNNTCEFVLRHDHGCTIATHSVPHSIYSYDCLIDSYTGELYYANEIENYEDYIDLFERLTRDYHKNRVTNILEQISEFYELIEEHHRQIDELTEHINELYEQLPESFNYLTDDGANEDDDELPF